MSRNVRTVKTVSGAMAVQVVYACWRGWRDVGHIGASAHGDAGLEVLRRPSGRRAARV